MRLQLCTWQEVERYLQRSTGIILPIGSTEQHGPNGLLGTDAICPETIAEGVAQQVDAMVGPTINIGMAQHHMAFAGTITLRPSTLMAVVRDVIESLSRHGFTHFYFLNGHGGNYDTVRAAFAEVHAEAGLAARGARRPVRCRLMNWWNVRGVKRLSQELFGHAEGLHATPSEVSLTYFVHPEAVKQVSMAPRTAPRGAFHDAEDFRRRFPDGRIGSDPSLASIEAGERILRAAVEDLAQDYRSFLASD
jgi:creatinine amidohydrolase